MKIKFKFNCTLLSLVSDRIYKTTIIQINDSNYNVNRSNYF